MTKTEITFNFLDKDYDAEVEYFEPPGVMPYYKVNISDLGLQKEFGAIHNFKEVRKNGWTVLEPAIDPQGKYHAYFWACLMTSIYIILLNDDQEIDHQNDAQAFEGESHMPDVTGLNTDTSVVRSI